MSKRITLDDREREAIIVALKSLCTETSHLSYEVVLIGQRFYNDLIVKLSDSPEKGQKP